MSKLANDNGKGHVAPKRLQDAVRRLVALEGEGAACARLRVTRSTLARIGCGLGVRRPALELAALQLGIELQAEGRS